LRVSFYWAEADPELGGVVPQDLTERVSPFCCAMKGTAHKPLRCVALAGAIGQAVRCTIYEQRPSPCREFGVQEQEGRYVIASADLIRCNRARGEWGLADLRLTD
jgi:hypothetical protein